MFNEEEASFNEFQSNIKEEVNKYQNRLNLKSEMVIEFNDTDIDLTLQ
jgi:hypothetical protein